MACIQIEKILRFLQDYTSRLAIELFCDIALNVDQCRGLATMSRLDVELVLSCCGLSNDAAGAFVECLQSDRGSVELFDCNIDIPTLARALTGNSGVTSLKPYHPYPMGTNDVDVAILVAALAHNRGLVNLDLQYCYISDDNWIILCESMKAHPTLTNLNLRTTGPRSPTSGFIVHTMDDQKAHRTWSRSAMAEKSNSGRFTSICLRKRDQDYKKLITI
jgi:hypothetical protein